MLSRKDSTQKYICIKEQYVYLHYELTCIIIHICIRYIYIDILETPTSYLIKLITKKTLVNKPTTAQVYTHTHLLLLSYTDTTR